MPHSPDRNLTDDALLARTSRLLSLLIEGITAAPHRCTCGRLFHLGVSAETKSLIYVLWNALLQRSHAPAISVRARTWFASRWLAMEYD